MIDDLKRSVFLYREASEVHVFRDASGRNRLKLLMHHGDSLFHCIIRVLDLGFDTVKEDFPFVHRVDAEEALHKCGFARTVFPHQGMY